MRAFGLFLIALGLLVFFGSLWVGNQFQQIHISGEETLWMFSLSGPIVLLGAYLANGGPDLGRKSALVFLVLDLACLACAIPALLIPPSEGPWMLTFVALLTLGAFLIGLQPPIKDSDQPSDPQA